MQCARRRVWWAQGGLKMVAPCCWGMLARRLITVGSRWRWVANGGSLLLANGVAAC